MNHFAAVKLAFITLAVLLCACAAPPAAAAPRYTVTVLPPAGAVSRFVEINNAGYVAGYVSGSTVLRSPDGALTLLPWRNGHTPSISALGDDGTVGLAYYDPDTPDRVLAGATWRAGVVQNLPYLRTTPDGFGYSIINSISTDGRQAGTSAVNGGFYDEYGVPTPYTHAVVYANGQLQDLGTLGGNSSTALSINDRGEVVGFSGDANGDVGSFIYRDGKMLPLGLGAGTYSFEINNAGQVLANRLNPFGNAVLWENGQLTDLSLPGFGPTLATGLNNAGDIIGRAWGPNGYRPEGFIYSDGEFLLLSDLVTDPSWMISEPDDINDSGAIIGLGCQGYDCNYVLLTPVPEPATWLLLAGGLGMLAAFGRRQA